VCTLLVAGGFVEPCHRLLRQSSRNRATPLVPEPGAVTEWLRLAAEGDAAAFDSAFALVYEELRVLAHAQLRREVDGHTLETGALVHEAYLRLSNGARSTFDDRSHFLAIASHAMRRVLVEHARRTHAVKRGGAAVPLSLDAEQLQLGRDDRATSLVDLDEALSKLALLHERQAKVIECRFFGGLNEEETSVALGIGLRTVKRDWASARSWLYRELHGDEG
jgi:RNA polymerase sigma factor (TIGR02999 family)